MKVFQLLFIAMVSVSCGHRHFSFMEQGYQNFMASKTFDLLIVPGYPYQPNGKNKTLIERVQWAAYLYENGVVNKIIFTGGAVYTPYCESEIMGQYAVELGVPIECILLETKAEYSMENLINSLRIAEEMKATKIAVATDYRQCVRMDAFARKHNIDLDFIPLSKAIIKIRAYPELKIDNNSTRKKNFVSVIEKDGVITRWRKSSGKGYNWNYR